MEKLINFISSPLRKFYSRIERLAESKNSDRALFGIAFAESWFLPVMPDIMLIPAVLADKRNWKRTALICAAGSIAGGIVGYFIGVFFWNLIGIRIVDLYGLHDAVEVVSVKYQNHAFFTVLTGAFVPIPYKIITLTAGLFRIPLIIFIAASVLGRCVRFFAIAGAARFFGKKMERGINKYFNVISILFVLALIIGALILRYYINLQIYLNSLTKGI
ncbi:MAG: VTT domain-containing protein [Elusimicrobia bacterium]|nr:VTT domain-containing protein [Elusimicrobiota bacterium]